MARYPTADEYRSKPAKGIHRCDELLKKAPSDVQLLTTKLELTYLVDASKADHVLDRLASITPPLQDAGELCAIEDVVGDACRDAYPEPLTSGPKVSKMWDNAAKAATSNQSHRLDLLSLRFSRAISDNRMLDAQASLIQLKAAAPGNRVVYMAHAIVTQLLSASAQDLQSRLALMLARKAVADSFDADASLDVRVPGQIFALQEMREDLEKIREKGFRESKQVYAALGLTQDSPTVANGTATAGGESSSLNSSNAKPASDDQKVVAEAEALQKSFRESIACSKDIKTIEAFANDAITLFVNATSNLNLLRSRGAADPCFLAISALVKAFDITKAQSYLLQAALLAESLLAYYEHIHEAKMVLVYLYMRLGLGSLAMKHYDALNIKEVQYDTVGHAIFAGVAITHPHRISIPRKEDFEPADVAKRALAVYSRCEHRLADTEADVLSHGQTGMILDLHQLRASLRKSFTKRMIKLEQRRLARLGVATLKPKDVDPARPLAYWADITDNRDFNATFDFGFNVERALHGYLPPDRALLYALAADAAWGLAHEAPKCVQTSQDLLLALDRLDETSPDSDGKKSARDSEPARSQTLAGEVARELLRLIKAVDTKAPELGERIDGVREAVDELGVDGLVESSSSSSSRDGPAEQLVAHFCFADCLRIVCAACEYVDKKGGQEKQRAAELKKYSAALFEKLQQSARKRAASVHAGQVEDRLGRSDGTWASCRQLQPLSFCQSVAQSAASGWGSFLKMKLK